MNLEQVVNFIDKEIDLGFVREMTFERIGKYLEGLDQNFIQSNHNLNQLTFGLKEFKANSYSSYRKAFARFEKMKENDSLGQYKSYFTSTVRFFLYKFEDGITILVKEIRSESKRVDLALEGLGFYYMQINKYDEAILSFKESIRRNSKRSSLCMWGLGRAYAEIGDYVSSLDSYKKSFNTDDYIVARATNSITLIYRKQNKYNEALEKIEDELLRNRSDEGRSILLDSKGEILYDLDRHAEAIISYREAYNISKDIKQKTEVAFNIIDAYLDIEDLQAADKEIEKSLISGVDSDLRSKIQIRKARLYKKLEDDTKALGALDNGLKLDIGEGTRKIIIEEQIKIFQKRKNWPQVNKLLEKLKKLSIDFGDDESHLINYGKIQFQQGKHTEAILSFQNASKSQSVQNKAEAFLEIGKCHIELKDFKLALEYLNNSLSIKCSSYTKAQCLMQLSFISYSNRDFTTAIRQLQESKDSYQAPIHLISCIKLEATYLRADNRLHEAIALIDKNYELAKTDKQKAELTITRARSLREIGSFDRAITILNNVENLNSPKAIQAELYYERAECYSEIQDSNKAIEDYERAYEYENNPEDRALFKLKQGLLKFQESKYLEAMHFFESSICENTNTHYSPVIYLSLSMRELKKTKDDLSIFDKCGREANDNGRIFLNIGKAHFLTGIDDFESALNIINNNTINENSPLSGLFFFLKAKNLMLADRINEALSAAILSESILGREIGAEFLLSTSVFELVSAIHFRLSNYQMSKAYMEKAISLNSRSAANIFKIDKHISDSLKADKQRENFISGIDEITENQKFIHEKIPKAKKSKNSMTINRSQQKFSSEIFDCFAGGVEFGCHYTTAETALFHILPSQFNHDSTRGNEVNLRLNTLGRVNDIEEGEFHLDPSIQDPASTSIFGQLKNGIKNEMKVFCWSWTNEHLKNLTISSAPFLIPPMWSAYGDRHSGLCIVFDMDKVSTGIEEFCKRSSIELKRLQRVIYAYPQSQKNTNVIVKIDEFLEHKDNSTKSFFKNNDGTVSNERMNVLFFKPPHWNYEREYRLVLHHKSDNAYNISLPASCVKGIVIGKEVKSGFLKLLEEICNGKSWFLMRYDPTAANELDILQVIKKVETM